MEYVGGGAIHFFDKPLVSLLTRVGKLPTFSQFLRFGKLEVLFGNPGIPGKFPEKVGR